MEHVDAQQVIEPRLGGLVVVAEGGCAGRLDATGKHVVDVPQELPHLVCRDQTGNDQKALGAEAHILVHRNGVASTRAPGHACGAG